MEDDTETKARIEEAVRKILEESNMDEVTESKIWKQAYIELGLDLSLPPFKAFVKQVVQAFLEDKQQVEEQQEGGGFTQDKEFDDDGDLHQLLQPAQIPPLHEHSPSAAATAPPLPSPSGKGRRPNERKGEAETS